MDGIRATFKRTGDAVVAAGGDIENQENFMEAIENRCPAIIFMIVDDTYIQEISV